MSAGFSGRAQLLGRLSNGAGPPDMTSPVGPHIAHVSRSQAYGRRAVSDPHGTAADFGDESNANESHAKDSHANEGRAEETSSAQLSDAPDVGKTSKPLSFPLKYSYASALKGLTHQAETSSVADKGPRDTLNQKTSGFTETNPATSNTTIHQKPTNSLNTGKCLVEDTVGETQEEIDFDTKSDISYVDEPSATVIRRSGHARRNSLPMQWTTPVVLRGSEPHQPHGYETEHEFTSPSQNSAHKTAHQDVIEASPEVSTTFREDHRRYNYGASSYHNPGTMPHPDSYGLHPQSPGP
jgi:hypothetical protein